MQSKYRAAEMQIFWRKEETIWMGSPNWLFIITLEPWIICHFRIFFCSCISDQFWGVFLLCFFHTQCEKHQANWKHQLGLSKQNNRYFMNFDSVYNSQSLEGRVTDIHHPQSELQKNKQRTGALETSNSLRIFYMLLLYTSSSFLFFFLKNTREMHSCLCAALHHSAAGNPSVLDFLKQPHGQIKHTEVNVQGQFCALGQSAQPRSDIQERRTWRDCRWQDMTGAESEPPHSLYLLNQQRSIFIHGLQIHL